MNRLKLKLDGSALLEALSEVRQGSLNINETLPELCTVNVDRLSTPLADELLVRLEPSKGLMDLVIASRTRDVDFNVVEKIGHKSLP